MMSQADLAAHEKKNIGTEESDIFVLPYRPEDSPGLKRLLAVQGEDGPVVTKMHLRLGDVGHAWGILSPGTYCLVAHSKSRGEPVGYITGWYHPTLYGGISDATSNIKGAVRINGFVLHPAVSGVTVGLALFKAMLEWAKNRFLDEQAVVVYACIQKVDADLKAVLAELGGVQTARRLILFPAKVVAKSATPPVLPVGFKVREADSTELEEVAGQLNEFYQGYDLYIPQSGQTLEDWLKPVVLEEGQPAQSLAHYRVIVDSAGEIVAGLGVFNTVAIYNLKVTKISPVLKLLNHFLKIIPQSMTLDALMISRVWYKAGYLEAAQALWLTVRVEESKRGRCNNLIVTYDPKSPLEQVYRLPRFYPKSKMSLILFTNAGASQALLSNSSTLLAPYES